MTGGWGKKVVAGVSCVVAAGATISTVGAQETVQSPGGVEITGGLSSSLRFTDNKALSANSAGITTEASTNLRLGFASETALDRLTFGVSGGLRFENPPNGSSDTELSDPTFDFRYRRTGAQSNLSFDARYSERRISDFVLIDADDDFVLDDLIFDTGDLTSLSYGASLNTGVGGPLGFGVTYRHSERDYSGTEDPDLFDKTTDSVRISSRLALSPVMTARLFANWSEFDEDDVEQTNRETLTYGVGVSYDLSALAATTVDGEIRFNDFETRTVSFGEVVVEETSVDGSLILTRDLPNGNLVGSLFSNSSPETTRVTARVDRLFEAPDSTLNLGVGLSDSNTGDAQIVSLVDYARELPWGEVGVSFSQSANIGSDDEEYLLTEVGARYLRELTPTSSVDATFELGRADDIGFGATSETTRASLVMTYRQELVEDWDWGLGYEGQISRSSGGTSSISHGVFATIDRSFTIRP